MFNRRKINRHFHPSQSISMLQIQVAGIPALANQKVDVNFESVKNRIIANLKGIKDLETDLGMIQFIIPFEEIWDLKLSLINQQTEESIKNLGNSTVFILEQLHTEVKEKMEEATEKAWRHYYDNFSFLIRTCVRVSKGVFNARSSTIKNIEIDSLLGTDEFNQGVGFLQMLRFKGLIRFMQSVGTDPHLINLLVSSLITEFYFIFYQIKDEVKLEEEEVKVLSNFMVRATHKYAAYAMSLGFISNEISSEDLNGLVESVS